MFHVKQKRVAFRSPAGACLLCRLPTLPFVCLSAPFPPDPLPSGKGEIFLFSYARGFAPCIPGIKSPTALTVPAVSVSGGGCVRLVACCPCLWFAFLPPSPRPPSPVGKGEIYGFLMQGAPPLASPGLSPRGTDYFLPRQCFSAPIPPTPFPRGEGGDFCFILPGAGAPGTPAAKPARCWLAGRLRPLHPRG